MARTSKRVEMPGASSALTLTSLIRPANSPARCSRAGLTARHGPHHGAQMSTKTGSTEPVTTLANVSFPASPIQGSGALHFAHRGMPLVAHGTRFLVPHDAHRATLDPSEVTPVSHPSLVGRPSRSRPPSETNPRPPSASGALSSSIWPTPLTMPEDSLSRDRSWSSRPSGGMEAVARAHEPLGLPDARRIADILLNLRCDSSYPMEGQWHDLSSETSA